MENKPLNEQEFIAAIRKATGKDLGEYGFIMGTSGPFMMKGMMSANKEPGYIIWKRNNDGSYSEARIARQISKNLEAVIDFLRDDVEFYKKSLANYYD